MPLLDEIRAAKLIELARARFDLNLSEAERKVLRDSASSEEFPDPGEEAPRPEVRAEFLRWLASDPDVAPHIDPRGVRVCASTIPGLLNLQGCHVNPILDFRRCTFQREIVLISAETRGVYILGSSLVEGVSADGAIIHGPIFLMDTQSDGEIRLLGAEIDSQLVCNGAKLTATGNALDADGAKIGGSVLMMDGFQSEGSIRLLGAEIGGNLDCSGAKLAGNGDALVLDGVQIGGDIFLRGGFECSGEIRVLGARAGGDLDCSGAKLTTEGYALSLDNVQIGGGVFLRDGFGCSGAIRLHGARIGGTLDCSGAKLTANGNAIYLDGAQIGGSVFLRGGFECSGAIRLPGTRIGGDVSFVDATLATVLCQNMFLGGDLIWYAIRNPGAASLGLVGARIKNLRDDRASWPAQDKLDADGLVFEELTLHASSSEEDLAAYMHPKELELKAGERVDWLMLQPEARRTEPQPWMQLRDLLERKGDRKGAKQVVFKYRCLLARKSWLLWRWLSIAFLWLEENPLRIGYSMLFFLTLGTLVFAGAARSGAMIETVQVQPAMIASYADSAKGVARKPDESIKPVSIHHSEFQPFIYTLENAVPLVKLGMDDKWMPDLQHQPQPWFPGVRWLGWLGEFNSYGFLVVSRWILIVAGWLQATIFAAAVADRFKK